MLSKAEEDVVAYCSEIQQYDGKLAFHVMGESVYCFHIIRLLKEKGYVVVASTTERSVVFQGFQKVSLFEFIKFREY